MTTKDFYYNEWQTEEKNGKQLYEESCKQLYRECVMLEIIKPYHFYHDKLKLYPLIILN